MTDQEFHSLAQNYKHSLPAGCEVVTIVRDTDGRIHFSASESINKTAALLEAGRIAIRKKVARN